MIVVDASAWVVALLDAGARGDAARRTLSADPAWTAPSHMPIEVLRTLRRYEDAGRLSAAAADAFAQQVCTAEVRLIGPDETLLTSVWRLRHNLSPYDAPYVDLAARLGADLVTGDGRLARAAQTLGTSVVVV